MDTSCASLAAGKSAEISLDIDGCLLGNWRDGKWRVAAGRHIQLLGRSATDLDEPISIVPPARG